MMIRLCIDDQVSEFNPGDNCKVGEVVQRIVSELPPNRIVREITLNGRHLTLQNGDASLESDFVDLKELNIRTADTAIWAASGLDIALTCVEGVQRSLLRAAELFRDETKSGEANLFFVHCIEGLERFIETIVITRAATKLDFSRIEVDGVSLTQIEHELMIILDAIVRCQESQDFSGVADRVEYALLTNLSAWARALKQLRLSAMSNA